MLESILEKYDYSFLASINRENLYLNANFLYQKGCYFLEDILEDYLDILTMEYTEFQKRYLTLEQKYGPDLIEKIGNDMAILEEFF